MELTPPVAPPRKKLENDSGASNTTKSAEELKADKFFELHSEAFKITSEAMKLDEDKLRDQAFNSYQKALLIIDKAVELAHSGNFPPDKVNKIDELVYKMRMTRKEILERVSDIQHSSSSSTYLAGPSTSLPSSSSDSACTNPRLPSYESLSAEAGAVYTPTPISTHVLYSDLSMTLDEIGGVEEESSGGSRSILPLNAQEVFSIGGNVQIYFISREDAVSAPTYPSFLRVVTINKDESQSKEGNKTRPEAFLQVGDWTYPLVHGQSPIYLSPDGTYLFPDLRAETEGASVGLILPPDLPADEKAAFEEILLQLIGQVGIYLSPTPSTAVTPEEPEQGRVLPRSISSHEPLPAQGMGYKFAAGFMSGAEKVAQGLVYGAEKTSQYMEKGTNYLVSRLEPAQEKSTIQPELKKGMKRAKSITGKAVQISGYLVTQLSRGTVKLGTHLAPYAHKAATQLYAKASNSNEAEASGKMDQIMEATGGAVAGFGTLYMGLEHAGKVLANSIANNTVTIVQHRYGQEAGAFAGDTASTIGNTVVTGYNCKGFAPKALAKRVAKDAGKAVVTSKLQSSPEKKDLNKKE